MTWSLVWVVAAGMTALAMQAVPGPALTGAPLVASLRSGGLVLVMRHASAPREAPSPKAAHADNPTRERQLDIDGERGATALGEAVRALRIPIAAVRSSPTYRARQTVQFARLAPMTVVEALGDGGQSMAGVTQAQAEWLRDEAAMTPPAGNVLLVTHAPNLTRAFPEWGATVADGEIVVLRQGVVVGRIPIAQWPALQRAAP